MTTPSPEPRWLNEDDGEVWVAFVSMLIWLPTALDDQLQRDSSMSHYEYGILAALSGADAATLRMSELAMFANGSLPRLSRAVARLEGRKWVTRKPDPADGRYTLAVLTDKGRKVLVEAAPGHVEAVNRLVFDVLSTAQARQLGIIARRILKAIDSETDLISRLLPKFGHVSSLWGSGRGEPDAR
jgi:DNA-binding MarR family transcriptional regulator